MKKSLPLILPLALSLPMACASAEKKPVEATSALKEVTVTGKEKLVVDKTPEEVGLPRTGPLYFETDSETLSKASQEQLFQIADYLLAEKRAKIAIEGHCDLRGSTEYNLGLGDRRAESAKKFLKRLGVEPERVKTVSFGEERPAADGRDESALSKNRRDEFRFVLDGSV